MTLFDGGGEPHEFKPGACALCNQWHTNQIHDVEPRAVDAPVNPVGKAHPETARRHGRKFAPRLGTIRRRVYDHIERCGWLGATAKEAGRSLGLEHQSYSPAVTTLKQDGWIRVDIENGRPRERDGAEVMVIARRIP